MRHLPRLALLALLFAGSAFITASSLGYFDDENLPPFVIEKLPVRFEALWLGSLRVHVLAAALSLPSCLLLMTRWLQRRVAAHRWLGRATGAVILVGLVPSGVVLAFDAKGGPLVTVGFLLSGALIAYFMVQGIVSARRRELLVHRRATWHVVAQMSVAVTSRALLLALEAAAMDPDVAYVVALWGPVLASAAVVELLSLTSERNRREDPPVVAARGALAPSLVRVGR
ncbi:MAG: DUF2306 domain-containing protein [Myxococcaceae bacterium]|nr:DUF2306 domain-containing protein [Myxococcaceae bacterium]